MGHIRILESYRVPHQFLLDETLFIPLKISLTWSLNRYGVRGVISSVQTTNHTPATGLLKNCEFDETYDRVTMCAEAKFLTV